MNPKTSTAADATLAPLGQLVPDLQALDSHVTPDVVVGQRVMTGPRRGAHGSKPQASIDPVVMAAARVMRLYGAEAEGRRGELPTNHHPNHHPGFAPVIPPTLETGVEALVVASLAWLAP